MIKDEFNNKIGRLTKSRAYLNYCEEVYGYRAHLFNMMDKQQIDFILQSINLTSNDTVLDLGCGSGGLLNLLISKYGCQGIGIDQLDSSISGNTCNKMRYIQGDIDRISEFHLKPGITLSVDSLYFSSDLDKLVRELQGIGNNKWYFFYSQYILDGRCEDKSILRKNYTKIAESLNRAGISYHTIDFSENERRLYENALRTLPYYKTAFEEEGNIDLYNQKRKEDLFGRELYDKQLASRFLYMIDNK